MWSGCWLWGAIGVFFCVFFRLVLVGYLIASRKPQYSLTYSFEFFFRLKREEYGNGRGISYDRVLFLLAYMLGVGWLVKTGLFYVDFIELFHAKVRQYIYSICKCRKTLPLQCVFSVLCRICFIFFINNVFVFYKELFLCS